MNPDRKILILATISIVALVIASVSATMLLLPKSDTIALPPARTVDMANIARSPIAPTLDQFHTPPFNVPRNITITLETREVVAEIDAGETYKFWTFNGTVPGPMIRVVVNDIIEVRIVNPASSGNLHSIDLHAVIGPGGGANFTQSTAPGASTSFKFKAIRQGLYVYHCATPLVDHHIANGMYGMILVEPEEGLQTTNPVDKEFYVMQGDFYTKGNIGNDGHHDFDTDELPTANPDYVVFNGKVGALTGSGALTANTNDVIRIFFGVGGPNLASSFHIIGEIFDKVYPEGSLFATFTNVQTTMVPAGGSTIVQFTAYVMGTYLLVDHSLTRAIQKGAAGELKISGPSAPDVYGFD